MQSDDIEFRYAINRVVNRRLVFAAFALLITGGHAELLSSVC